MEIIKLGSNNFLSTLKKATTVAGDVLTTKGDILSRSASALGRLGIGSNDQVLTADSAQPLGLKWATAGGGGTSFQEIVRKTSDQANDTTNLVNDSQLKLAIGTSKTFVFTFYAILQISQFCLFMQFYNCCNFCKFYICTVFYNLYICILF